MTGRGRTEPLDTFIKVPTFVLELASAGVISPRAFLLYSALRSHRNNRTGTAWASNRVIAQEAGIAKPGNVARVLSELIDAGAVVVSRRDGATNVYSFPENPTHLMGEDPDLDTHLMDEVPPTSRVRTPPPHTVGPPHLMGEDQTIRSELDELTTSNERLVDTSRPPLRSAGAERQPIQPPLMNSVKPPRIPEASFVEDQLRKLDQLLGRSAPYTGLFGRGPSDTEAARVLLYQGESLEVVASIIRDSKRKVS